LAESVLASPFQRAIEKGPVVLLYLTPGWCQEDVDEAGTPKGQARYAERRRGYQPLEGPEDHMPSWKWWSSRTKPFGPWEKIREKVAILNISGYHSKTFTNEHVLAALPSSRATLDWAQEILFPQAEKGERTVICMRSSPYWGLGKTSRYGEALFAPSTTRSGHMLKWGEHGAIRDEVRAAAQAAIAKS
jgi:hypothetical protein